MGQGHQRATLNAMVGSLLGGMKYFIFSFHRSGNAKRRCVCGVVFRYSTHQHVQNLKNSAVTRNVSEWDRSVLTLGS